MAGVGRDRALGLIERETGDVDLAPACEPQPASRRAATHTTPVRRIDGETTGVHLTDEVLAPIRALYGEPTMLEWGGEISEHEYGIATYDPVRTHDVTLFILNGQRPGRAWTGVARPHCGTDRLALIRKHPFPPDVWRPPGGGVKEGEEFVEAVRREAYEETGLRVELERYLVETRARFVYGGRVLDWRTHVCSATTADVKSCRRTLDEIAEARWGSLDELAGRCASGCSPRAERSGATGSRSTMLRWPRSLRTRPRVCPWRRNAMRSRGSDTFGVGSCWRSRGPFRDRNRRLGTDWKIDMPGARPGRRHVREDRAGVALQSSGNVLARRPPARDGRHLRRQLLSADAFPAPDILAGTPVIVAARHSDVWLGAAGLLMTGIAGAAVVALLPKVT